MAFVTGAANTQCIKIPNRIFVGGISFNTTREELLEFFMRYGAVRDAKIICDEQGVSKGYGFVTFYKEEVANRLLNMGTIYFKAKKLNVGEAFRKITDGPYIPSAQYNPVDTSSEVNSSCQQGGVTATQAVYYNNNSYYNYYCPYSEVPQQQQQQQYSVVPTMPIAPVVYQTPLQQTATVYPSQNNMSVQPLSAQQMAIMYPNQNVYYWVSM